MGVGERERGVASMSGSLGERRRKANRDLVKNTGRDGKFQAMLHFGEPLFNHDKNVI